MAEQRFIQKDWKTDSITPIFKDDPSAQEIGEIDSVRVYTEAEHEEVMKLRALYRATCAFIDSYLLDEIEEPELCYSDHQRETIARLGNARKSIDGGTYNPKIGGEDVDG